jgi:hypothetical protein
MEGLYIYMMKPRGANQDKLSLLYVKEKGIVSEPDQNFFVIRDKGKKKSFSCNLYNEISIYCLILEKKKKLEIVSLSHPPHLTIHSLFLSFFLEKVEIFQTSFF